MNIREELLEIISFQTATSKDDIVNSRSWKEAGIDSLDTLEVMLTISEKYDIVIDEEDEDTLVNFNKLASYIEEKLK